MDYLTADEVAAQLRVSGEAVREWCRMGKLKAVKAGRQWRIKPGDLEAYLNRLEAQSEEVKKLTA